MDCWDGPAGEPVVYHGNTMTSRIYVRDICQAVKDFGFVTTPYPIVLSLEVHCGEEQQGRMAEIFSVVFGEMLFCSPSDPSVPCPAQSPQQLRYRVLLKVLRSPLPCWLPILANILEQRWVYPTLRRDFDHYAQNSPMMTADAFAAFLREKQKVCVLDSLSLSEDVS